MLNKFVANGLTLTYQPVVVDYEYVGDGIFEEHLNNAFRSSDQLASNYTLDQIRCMREYGYVWNENKDDLVLMVGLQPFANNAFRAGSRTYVGQKYRTRMFKSPDNLVVSSYHINLCSSDEFVFETREKNSTSLKWLMKNPTFSDWILHDEKIELKWKQNWQWMMYRPTTLDVQEIISSISPDQCDTADQTLSNY